MKIFVSYRRAVSSGTAGRLYDRLREVFGDDSVFMDVESIPLGETFDSFILKEIESSSIFLSLLSEGTLHGIDNENDFIRLELRHALLLPHVRVIPVLIDNFKMPSKETLPVDISGVVDINGQVLIHSLFEESVNRIIINIKKQSLKLLSSFIESNKKNGDEVKSSNIINFIRGLEDYTSSKDILHVINDSSYAINNVEGSCVVNDGMVKIPSGFFVSGDNSLYEQLVHSNWDKWRLPELTKEHIEFVSSYWIDLYPVTNKSYKKFIDETGYRVPYLDEDRANGYNWDKDTRTYPKGKDNHPVVLISWHDAMSYAEWKNSRLPTAIEWELAARGFNSLIYPWGYEKPSSLISNNDNNEGGTTPVTKYSSGVSPFGCYDMAGNVWNWCSDSHPIFGDLRLMKGNSWDFSAVSCHTALHDFVGADELWNHDGFRCVKDVDL